MYQLEARGGAEEKEEKEQSMRKNIIKHFEDGPTERPLDEVSYRGACMHLKKE
jgi:hypothetical protein